MGGGTGAGAGPKPAGVKHEPGAPRRKRRPQHEPPPAGGRRPDRRARFGGLDVTPSQLAGPAVRASAAAPPQRTPGKAGGKTPETPARPPRAAPGLRDLVLEAGDGIPRRGIAGLPRAGAPPKPVRPRKLALPSIDPKGKGKAPVDVAVQVDCGGPAEQAPSLPLVLQLPETAGDEHLEQVLQVLEQAAAGAKERGGAAGAAARQDGARGGRGGGGDRLAAERGGAGAPLRAAAGGGPGAAGARPAGPRPQPKKPQPKPKPKPPLFQTVAQQQQQQQQVPAGLEFDTRPGATAPEETPASRAGPGARTEGRGAPASLDTLPSVEIIDLDSDGSPPDGSEYDSDSDMIATGDLPPSKQLEVARIRAQMKRGANQIAGMKQRERRARKQRRQEQRAGDSVSAQDLLGDVISAVTHDLEKKYKHVLRERAAGGLLGGDEALPPPPEAPEMPKKVHWLAQHNLGSATIREVFYQRPRRPQRTGKWYVNLGRSSKDWAGTPNWVEITDPTVTSKLASLDRDPNTLHGRAIGLDLRRTVHKSIEFMLGANRYKVQVHFSVKPWDLRRRDWEHEEALEARRWKAAEHWKRRNFRALTLLDGPLVAVRDDRRIRGAHTRLDTSGGMRAVAGHAGLAGLAELWSSFSCGFRYDPARTQLWVKPFLLGRWLTLLHDREYEVRVVGHGVRSGRYDRLAKDPAGFKPESWHEHGNGIYVSPFDAIPADLGRSSTGGGPSARAYPDGTFVLALLLTEPGAAKMGKPPHEDWQTKWFHLGSARRGYIENGPSGATPGNRPLDAIVVKDPSLLLPLGLVVARE